MFESRRILFVFYPGRTRLALEDRLVLPLSTPFSSRRSPHCPQVVSQAPQHFRTSEKQATCEGCFFSPVYLLGHFPSLRHLQGSTATGVFEGGCRQLTHSNMISLPFHFLLFIYLFFITASSSFALYTSKAVVSRRED